MSRERDTSSSRVKLGFLSLISERITSLTGIMSCHQKEGSMFSFQEVCSPFGDSVYNMKMLDGYIAIVNDDGLF